MDKELYRIYGLTNKKSKNPNECIIFCKDYNNLQENKTYSIQYYLRDYYKNEKAMKLSDFKYVIELLLLKNNLYIVETEKDIIKNMFKNDGRVNFDLLTRVSNRNIKGVVMFDISNVNKKKYIPYLYVLPDIIKKSKIIYKRVPKQRNWISLEDCTTMNHFECVDSQSCFVDYKNDNVKIQNGPLSFEDIIKMDIVKGKCNYNKQFQKLPFFKLNKVLIPYKLYTFVEFETSVYDSNKHLSNSFKPNGLWFAHGDEWLQYIKKTNFFMTRYNYLYEIEVFLERIIYITNLKELYEFSKQYCSGNNNDTCMTIDWNKVLNTTKKMGIFITPNLKSILRKYKEHDDYTNFQQMEWYLTWDIASGVVWNKNAIQKFKLIYKQEYGTLEKYSPINKKTKSI
jgi:hypothetical protein